MKIEIETLNIETVEVVNTRTGTTVFNTDDYTELKGKTIGEIKQMDLEELLELKTNDGTCLVNTMEYGTYVHDEGLDVRDLDGCETEITTIG